MKKFTVRINQAVSDNEAWFADHTGEYFEVVLPTDPAFQEKGLMFGPTPGPRYVILADLIEGAENLRTIPVIDVSVIQSGEIETPGFEKLLGSRPAISSLMDLFSAITGGRGSGKSNLLSWLKEKAETCDCPECTAKREAEASKVKSTSTAFTMDDDGAINGCGCPTCTMIRERKKKDAAVKQAIDLMNPLRRELKTVNSKMYSYRQSMALLQDQIQILQRQKSDLEQQINNVNTANTPSERRPFER